MSQSWDNVTKQMKAATICMILNTLDYAIFIPSFFKDAYISKAYLCITVISYHRTATKTKM